MEFAMILPRPPRMVPWLAAALVLALAAPAAALPLADLAGRWRGEGTLTVQGEPPQRVQCQLRGTPSARGIVVVGRCATAQGGESYAWAVTDLGGGELVAEDRRPATGEPGTPPARLPGRAWPDRLEFSDPDGGTFAIARDAGGDLRLTVTSVSADGRRVQAAASLARQP